MRTTDILIATDIDEVLAHCHPQLMRFHNEVYGTCCDLNDSPTYDLKDVWGCSQEEAKKRLMEFYESEYFRMIEPIEESKLVVEYLAAKYPYVAITARDLIVKDATLEFMEEHFPAVQKTYFANEWAVPGNGNPKGRICEELGARFMKEDAPSFVHDCAGSGVHVFLNDRGWNRHIPDSDYVTRVTGLSETIEPIERMVKR